MQSETKAKEKKKKNNMRSVIVTAWLNREHEIVYLREAKSAYYRTFQIDLSLFLCFSSFFFLSWYLSLSFSIFSLVNVHRKNSFWNSRVWVENQELDL